MSILIKGMEMPTSCQECIAGYGGCCFVAPPETDGICSDHGKSVWCPLSDVLYVNHAEWVEDGYYNEPWVCSNCGYPCNEIVMERPKWNYCPCCGAKMQNDDEGVTVRYDSDGGKNG